MPFILSLPAPASPISLGRCVTSIPHLSTQSIGISKRPRSCSITLRYPTFPTAYHRWHSLLALVGRPTCPPPGHSSWTCPWRPSVCGVRDVHLHDSSKTSQPNVYKKNAPDEDFVEDPMDYFIKLFGVGAKALDQQQETQLLVEHTVRKPFCGQLSRRSRKFLRPSRPTQVLQCLNGSSRELYLIGSHDENGFLHTNSHHNIDGSVGQSSRNIGLSQSLVWLREPASLDSILGRFLDHYTSPDTTGFELQFTRSELELLRSRRYTGSSVERWTSCLVEPRSNVAVRVFEPGVEMPPYSLLLLFLRRKHLRTFALGVVMRHIGRRTKSEPCSWANLKSLVIRLLRHARESWPESFPWIASLFVTETTRLHTCERNPRTFPTKMLSDLTQFCNSFLSLLSLPTTLHPLLSASYQEKAQFLVLQYMANASPPILVNREGFRSVTRTQLAHPKTEQEREWAELKGPSWPPWKENRTAMDEEKGYEFGLSRASKILHRMYEAGYRGGTWEKLAEVYAGWDSDLSPTIQSRTSMLRFSTQYWDQKHLRSLLWAGRIRTTRTRREAWACFLAHESSNAPAHQDIYHAMFEKLYYPTMERTPTRESQIDLENDVHQPDVGMLPGDMKEVSPDPKSPLHHVFLSEPVPTYTDLYHRMRRAQLRPSGRLLAFLLETWPDFTSMLDILTESREYSDSGLDHLVAGKHFQDSAVNGMPDYMFAAFIRFLCRFGRFNRPPPVHTNFMAPEQHASYFHSDKNYLLEYAYSLLVRYRPRYRPAWAVYMKKVVQQKGSERAAHVVRYPIICHLLDIMEEIDIDVDDEIFRLVCIAATYAVQTIDQGFMPTQEARSISFTSSSRLRTLFHGLVGANADTQQSSPTHNTESTIQPHVPSPADVHAYVRALGALRDYEGLYSFSTWLTRHHVQVTAQAEARQSGNRMLFRMLVALRAAVDGELEVGSNEERGASTDIAQLIRMQIEGVEGWGGWPARAYVDMYIKGNLKSPIPSVRGQ